MIMDVYIVAYFCVQKVFNYKTGGWLLNTGLIDMKWTVKGK
jgi:hypothetical protein